MMSPVWALTPISAFVKTLLEPSAVLRAVRRRMPNVVHVGYRATCTKVQKDGRSFLRKSFSNQSSGLLTFTRECLADDLFGDRPWKMLAAERGNRWLMWPYLPDTSRLDIIGPSLSTPERWEVARQALEVLREIHAHGYAHRDFHAKNMFWHNGQLIVTDFEWMEKYPPSKRPAFEQCYDLTGEHLPSPGQTGHCHFDSGDYRSLRNVLGISVAEILASARASA